MKILVLGAGRVGSAMVEDLLKDEQFSVAVADINPETLKKFACPTIEIRLIASGLYREIGVAAPERIGQSEDCVQFILDGLKERGIVIDQDIQES